MTTRPASRPHLRVATLDDAESLSSLSTATIEETYGHLYPAKELGAHLSEWHSPKAWRAFLGATGARTTLALEGDGPVGYALAGPCALPHPDVTPTCGELKRLYVKQAHQGRGLGRALLEASLGFLEEAGYGAVWLGVYAENGRALSLYARHGFERVGEYEFPVGRLRERELILRRR